MNIYFLDILLTIKYFGIIENIISVSMTDTSLNIIILVFIREIMSPLFTPQPLAARAYCHGADEAGGTMGGQWAASRKVCQFQSSAPVTPSHLKLILRVDVMLKLCNIRLFLHIIHFKQLEQHFFVQTCEN